MRLTSFRNKGDSRDRWGVVQLQQDGDGIAELTDADTTISDICEAISDLARLKQLASDMPITHALDEVELLPVIPEPQKTICIGLNYGSHVKETGRDWPEYPIIFTRYPQTHVGHGQPLVRPKLSERFDYEGELAFVIGKGGRHIPAEKALDHVAGYTCYNDGSIRDYQRHTSQFMPGKNFWRSGSMGPWLVTSDEIPDPSILHLTTRLNGEMMQDADLSDLIFDVPAIVAYVSGFLELSPGDVIATGTTGGVGAFHQPPRWMKPGDTIEVEISGIGTLANGIVDE